MPDEKLQENQEEEIEVEVEIEDEEQLSSSAEDSTDPKDSDELENYSEGVKKRISKLTAKMREAERREAAATEYAKAVHSQLEESKKNTASLDKSFVQEFENRLTAEEQLLHSSLKEAIDRGDVDKQVEVQKQMATVANQTERLSQAKKRQEEAATVVEQPVQQQVAQPQQAAPDPKATRWAAKNEWFGADEPMTLTAFSFHKNMVESEGYDPTSDDYYSELDRRMAEEFPHKLAKKSNNSSRSGPAVGAANRGSSGRGKQQVKLTPSQLAIVKKLGIKKEDYARQMLRMQNS